MYIPGRSRTGSRPSRTVMSLAVYAVSVIKKALQMSILRAESSVSETAVGAGLLGGSRKARRGRSRDEFAELLVLDPGRDRGGLRTVLGADLWAGRCTLLRRTLLRLRDRSGSEAQRLGSRLAQLGAELLEDRGDEPAELEGPGRRRRVHVQRSVPGEARGPRVPCDRLTDSGRPGPHDPHDVPVLRVAGHRPEAAELASHLPFEAVHQRTLTLPGTTSSSCAGSSGSASAPVAVTIACPTRPM